MRVGKISVSHFEVDGNELKFRFTEEAPFDEEKPGANEQDLYNMLEADGIEFVSRSPMEKTSPVPGWKPQLPFGFLRVRRQGGMPLTMQDLLTILRTHQGDIEVT